MDDIELGPLERSWGNATKASPVSSCLTAAEWIDFVERGEAADCYSKGVMHLAQCPVCRGVVQEMRAAELAKATSETANRLRSPLFGILRPASLVGAVATLAAASTVVAIKWKAHQSQPGSNSPAAVVARTSPVHHINSALPDAGVPTRPGSRSVPLRSTSPGVKLATGQTPTRANAPDDIDDPTAPATDQQYCLIGSDGVFTMPSPNFRLKDRQRIEESYADRVDQARRRYDAEAGVKGDLAHASAHLNHDLKSAAEERDQRLGTIYTRQDHALDKALNLRLEGGSPYQVVEVDYRVQRSIRHPVRVVVHAPWPGYHPSRRPYGWEYDTPYEPTEFKSRYVDWRKSYLAAGRPAFYGLVGHAGPLHIDTIFGSRYEGYATSREIARQRAMGGANTLNTRGYTHSQVPNGGFGQGAEPPGSTWSGYTHSPAPRAPVTQRPRDASGTNTSGYTHSGARILPSIGSGPANSGIGGYSHSRSSSQGPHTAPSIGGYTHSSPTQTGGYSRSRRGQQPNGDHGAGYAGSKKG